MREEGYLSRKKRYRLDKKKLFVSGTLGLVLVVLVIFGCAGLFSGTKPGDNVLHPILDKVRKGEVVDENGESHLVFRTDQWNLKLVNKWNPLHEEPNPELAILEGGHEIDARCEEEFLTMMEDCRTAGYRPVIISAYRTFDLQQTYYDGQTRNLMSQGLSEEEARKEAATSVAVPGTSEHHLGLALDIVDEGMQNLDRSQEDTPTQKWLMENSWKYGFIVRYPQGKEAITGIIYEPWHYRYVGKKEAREITEKNLCLEEYLANL